MDEKIGGYAFILGVVIAVILGLYAASTTPMTTLPPADMLVWLPLILVILGLIVGFLNIGDKEVMPFLVAAIALVLVGTAHAELALIPYIGMYLAKIVSYIALFAAPAALIVALLEFWKIASTQKGSSK